MQDAIRAGRYLARLAELTEWSLLAQLWLVALRIARLVARFRGDPLSPKGAARFEEELKRLLDTMGRLIMQWTLNGLESESRTDMPSVIFWERSEERRVGKECRL